MGSNQKDTPNGAIVDNPPYATVESMRKLFLTAPEHAAPRYYYLFWSCAQHSSGACEGTRREIVCAGFSSCFDFC